MKLKRVYAVYFSPTGTTRAMVTYLAEKIAAEIRTTVEHWDFTLPIQRQQIPRPDEADLFILGLPVYAGRLPNLLLNYLSSFVGRGAMAIPLVLFGNRSYGNALTELRDLLEKSGFHTIAAAAFVGQHSFTGKLAHGRPDAEDWVIADRFAGNIVTRIKTAVSADALLPVSVPGQGAPDYGGYYQPKGDQGEPVNILKVKPVTTTGCIRCKQCVGVCPLGSIDPEQVEQVTGICIKCNACVKICPVQAKQFVDPAYLSHLNYLESVCLSRAMVELFL